jgi:two-component system OmpR family response regulator
MRIRPLILLFMPNPDASVPAVRQAERLTLLKAQGLALDICGDLNGTIEQARRIGPDLAVLGGSLADSCLAASYLKALQPRLKVLTLLDPQDESALLQVLRSGADLYGPLHASPELLLALVLGLWKQLGVPEVPQAGILPAAWALVDQDWVLSSPDGDRVDLTTGERAFLQTLFLAPDLRARRADLMDAIDISYAAAVGAGKDTRLGVLVSRMRRKFQARGVVLPLRAVHGFGYMFAGKIRPATA